MYCTVSACGVCNVGPQLQCMVVAGANPGTRVRSRGLVPAARRRPVRIMTRAAAPSGCPPTPPHNPRSGRTRAVDGKMHRTRLRHGSVMRGLTAAARQPCLAFHSSHRRCRGLLISGQAATLQWLRGSRSMCAAVAMNPPPRLEGGAGPVRPPPPSPPLVLPCLKIAVERAAEVGAQRPHTAQVPHACHPPTPPPTALVPLRDHSPGRAHAPHLGQSLVAPPARRRERQLTD